ncbi:MAG: hypothetical protein L3J39_15760 [Verrucomicrobiales bacterium]|nr:hypothetical protein [Verrucomicrobiales bacterium]
MKLNSIVKTPTRLALLCLAGGLIILGILAENLPWGRGWLHDFTHYLKQKSTSYTPPDENSPEMAALQKKIDAWYPQILERYPRLKVEYKNVPDDQNGFLEILEWQEEVIGQDRWEPMALPSKFDKILTLENGNALISNELIAEAQEHLKKHQNLLARAIKIGLLPEQSIAGVSPNRILPLSLALGKNITDLLKLNALLEAHNNKSDAAYTTMKAMRGWALHYLNIETPTLLHSTLGIAILLNNQSTIHSQITPLLPPNQVNLFEWSKLMRFQNSLQDHWLQMMRGEWNVCLKTIVAEHLLNDNPVDPIAQLDSYTAAMASLTDPKFWSSPKWEGPLPPDKLSRKSSGTYEMAKLGMSAYATGYLRSHTILRQYQIAFALKKLEAEGHDLTKLDSTTLDSLPTQILPDLRLTIDFKQRQITAPKNKVPDTKRISF